MQAERPVLSLARHGDPADGVDDRDHGEQPRDGGKQDRGADAHQLDEPECEQRPADRAEVVHRALEAVRASVRARGDDVGQQRVARRPAQAASRPCPRTQDPDLPCARGDADQARQHRRGGVAADGDGTPALRVVRERAAGQLRRTGQRVRDALDQPQRRRGGAQGRGQERRQQRGRDLVAEVGEQRRRADAADPGRQPPLRLGLPARGDVHARHATRGSRETRAARRSSTSTRTLARSCTDRAAEVRALGFLNPCP